MIITLSVVKMSEELTSLIIDELNVPGIKPDADLSFISRFDLKPIWSFLAEHIKSRDNARLVQQNLAVLAHQKSCEYRVYLVDG